MINLFSSTLKKTVLFTSVIFVIAAVQVGCKKENTLKNEQGQVVVTGNFTLKITAKHHWWGVPYLPVYLKKNSTTWPGTDSTIYEFKTIADVDGKCEFTHLFPGNYYIYARGFDSVFGMNVIGYGPVQINSSTATDSKVEFILNVSE